MGTEYIIDLLNRFELSYIEHKKLSEYCRDKGITTCVRLGMKSLLLLEGLDVPAYKVASADLTNLNLIAAIIKTKKPIILSTGIITEQEIMVTTNFLNLQKLISLYFTVIALTRLHFMILISAGLTD